MLCNQPSNSDKLKEHLVRILAWKILHQGAPGEIPTHLVESQRILLIKYSMNKPCAVPAFNINKSIVAPGL